MISLNICWQSFTYTKMLHISISMYHSTYIKLPHACCFYFGKFKKYATCCNLSFPLHPSSLASSLLPTAGNPWKPRGYQALDWRPRRQEKIWKNIFQKYLQFFWFRSLFISLVPGDMLFAYLFSFCLILIVFFIGHLEKCHWIYGHYISWTLASILSNSKYRYC